VLAYPGQSDLRAANAAGLPSPMTVDDRIALRIDSRLFVVEADERNRTEEVAAVLAPCLYQLDGLLGVAMPRSRCWPQVPQVGVAAVDVEQRVDDVAKQLMAHTGTPEGRVDGGFERLVQVVVFVEGEADVVIGAERAICTVERHGYVHHPFAGADAVRPGHRLLARVHADVGASRTVAVLHVEGQVVGKLDAVDFVVEAQVLGRYVAADLGKCVTEVAG